MQRNTHTSHKKTAITIVREHVEDWRRALSFVGRLVKRRPKQ